MLSTRMRNTKPSTAIIIPTNSVLFKGTTDYISVPNNSCFQFGASDITFEFWVNFRSKSQHKGLFRNTSGSSLGYDLLWLVSTNQFNFRIGTGSTILNHLFNFTPTINTWYHIALVRNGTGLSCYISGVLCGTVPSHNSVPATDSFQIGRSDFVPTGPSWNHSSFFMDGYISNFRVVDRAVYTGNFTVPTSPLVAISGTQLLTCQSPSFIDNSINNFSIATTGAPEISPITPFPII
jgi:hypothetical protein